MLKGGCSLVTENVELVQACSTGDELRYESGWAIKQVNTRFCEQ